MSFVTETLTPIVSMSVLIAFLTGVGWLLYKGLNKLMPDLNLKLKYGLFKREMDSETVEWCYDLIKQEKTGIEAEMMLYKKNYPPKRIKETMYIFNEIKKELKGGLEHE